MHTSYNSLIGFQQSQPLLSKRNLPQYVRRVIFSSYYENRRIVVWYIFVQRPLPLSFVDPPTFLRVVVSWLS